MVLFCCSGVFCLLSWRGGVFSYSSPPSARDAQQQKMKIKNATAAPPPSQNPTAKTTTRPKHARARNPTPSTPALRAEKCAEFDGRSAFDENVPSKTMTICFYERSTWECGGKAKKTPRVSESRGNIAPRTMTGLRYTTLSLLKMATSTRTGLRQERDQDTKGRTLQRRAQFQTGEELGKRPACKQPLQTLAWSFTSHWSIPRSIQGELCKRPFY